MPNSSIFAKTACSHCNKPTVARGLCNAHYKQARVGKIPLNPLKKRGGYGRPPLERILPRLDKNGSVPPLRPELGACWLWLGAKNWGGYGRLNVRSGSSLVHRIMFEDMYGSIPINLQLDHLCRVRHCCNPKHLEAVTQKENILRGEAFSAKESRRTHCPLGHEYSQNKKGRFCRTCKKADDARYKLRKNKV